MDIAKLLLKEHTKTNTLKVVDYVGVNKKRFALLVNLFLNGPYRLTQRAAWPLSYCVERHPPLITPHLREVLRFMKQPGVHVAVKRNTVRLLQFADIPKRYRGEVIDTCFELLQNKKEPVAVKAFSITVLDRLTKAEPDLRKELRIVIEDLLPYASPAFVVRARKVLKEG